MNDFRAYYNTFYNARQAFTEATRAVEERAGRVDQDAYLQLFPGPEAVAAEEKLDAVIEKSADILREYPRSRWVDDALLLIGKAYFYQGNLAGAERKFREVKGLDERLNGGARVWLGRTLLAAGRYDEAEIFLEEQLSEGAGDARLHLLLGVLHVQREAWPPAAAALRQGLSGIEDDQLAARAYFLYGQVLETNGRFAEAAAAYDRAADLHARYELTYAAQVAAARALGKTGRPAEALRRVRALYEDDKNADRRAELAVLRSRLYRMQGRPDAARRTLRQVLYGMEGETRESAAGAARGRAHYELGLLYRDAYADYVRAAAHFDTAATALPSPAEGEAALRTPVAVTDAGALAETFGVLAEASHRVARLDSLLYLGSLSDEAFARFVEELRRKRARAQQQAADRARRQAAPDQDFRSDAGGRGQRGRQQALAVGGSSVGGDAGFLFHRDPARMAQARAAFFRRWGRRPHIPNWRRLSAVAAGGAGGEAPGTPAEEAGVGRREPAVSETSALPVVDVSAVPRDSAHRAEMRAERARARYQLAGALFLSAGRPDSAAVWYRRIIEARPEASLARRARYALAEMARARGDTARARNLYRRLTRAHAGTALAARARERLGENASAGVPAADVSSRTEAAYARAYALWQQERYAEAVEQAVALAARYRKAEAASRSVEAPQPEGGNNTLRGAPRALLMAGEAALAWVRRDTALFFGTPLPVAVADSLFAPGGLFAFARDTTTAPEAPVTADTLVARDTLRAAPPDTVATPDTVAAPAHRLRAEMLFAAIVEHYPEMPAAGRARLVLPPLRERAAADTLRAAVPPSPPADTVQAGPPAAAPPVDSTRRAAPGGASGPSSKSESAGGPWVIIVASGASRTGAEAAARRFRGKGYRAGVFPDRSAEVVRHRVGVGPYATREAAAAARRRHADALPADSWLHRLPGERN